MQKIYRLFILLFRELLHRQGHRGIGALVGDFLLTLFRFLPAFLLTLLQLLRRESSLRFLPLQLGQLRLHFNDQRLEFLLALLTGVGVDVTGVLFAVDPCGRVTALPQLRPLLRDASGAWSAAACGIRNRRPPGRFTSIRNRLQGWIFTGW